MPVNVVIGEQRGDEGKGRVVDMEAEHHDIVARWGGGNNAGHQVITPLGQVLRLHSIPSGVAHEHIVNVIGNGVVVNPVALREEMGEIASNGIELSPDNLKISSAAHFILPSYISKDEMRESGILAQGSTKKGIAQTYAAKSERLGGQAHLINHDPERLRGLAHTAFKGHKKARKKLGLEKIDVGESVEEFMEAATAIGPFLTDTARWLNKQLGKDKPARVLAEGAQAFLLDLDHGQYPYTTSSTTTVGGVATGLGIPVREIDRIIGVSKAIQSHVGDGPFVTEIKEPELLETLYGDMSAIDAEVGTTTGRVRRLGHLDLMGIKRSQMINGTTERALTKFDKITDYGQEVPVCVGYERKGRRVTETSFDCADKLKDCTPIYEWLPTWFDSKIDIQEVRDFDDLPAEGQGYIEFIENQTGVHISYIGVGPRRDQIIKR